MFVLVRQIFCMILKILAFLHKKQYSTPAETSNCFNVAISASTAFHAMELGFRTMVIEDCSRGIDEISIKAAYEKVRKGWGLIVHSSEVETKLTFSAITPYS